ncbi:NADH dehydrogenase [ubiquinone] 1 alpha subcomplex subunit 13 [Linepithema humile]|uniref:NADH dehydrogenase [ubiquinone] 1 alpha subcomplex subunit 13 n=1 Tax=Linepithema humile TaxID=83485 RepID=UPI00062322B8|nr:PREDICTED: NADH dehydrogenase [ubiquinone] 1 alpha subcomplex subunit 13 [Linepithema humile]XP_012215425.1 PREDICTED: NADH dehydrogenase [ubiquinone] 1 alpha subcomplex subunit 13 [Linepithema humile]XP_012215426.1 PREDICTED: NADH dehydrogenase [ubiquinone] 1 alpha subcomplex subunit 13 [Linepithema humile]XP_012215427.1 PREDICTED: NADH dehydrogenase [ubiquinone] 1 alpha subcomplex subunit 13 [Linepithema humile]XP_012215428.1 PREDICTED: NADH dehydrogenase [ubiquinone] 1 alpha subcomplex su
MATTTGKRVQDLPPRGGYASIQTERVKLRSILGARSTIGLFLTVTLSGAYCYYLNFKLIRRQQIEMRSSRLAIWPALLAERDRAVLKQMRRNRDEEAELMKNVDRWEVGTYYGEPIFFLDDENQYRDPLFMEHFAHSDPDFLMSRSTRHLWT